MRTSSYLPLRTVLIAMLLVLTAPVAPAVAGRMPQRDPVAARIDRFLAAQLEDSPIPGAAVAVTRGDRVQLVRGYGHDSAGAPVTGDSLFRIASLSKSFTALAVMQLADAGLLRLDDPVHRHLPEFHLADPRGAQITVRQLLDQTSGITDAVVPDLSRRQPRSSTDATTSLGSAHLATTPGRSWSYANANYQVAARLVEVVSGEPFGRYLRRHVFRPAGMVSTTSTVRDDEPVPGLAEGHLIAYGHAVPVPGLGFFTAGDGGIVSSAADMARWLVVNAHAGRAPDGTRLVSRHGMRVLHTPSAPRVGYALGWGTHGPRDAPTRLEHSGSLFTFTSEEALWPASGYGVVLLFNSGSPMMLDQTAIVHGVFDIVEGTNPPASSPQLATRLDMVLGALTLAALALGISGVARAGRWARRRRSSRLLALLSSLPAGLVVATGVVFPRLVEAWLGRDVTWHAAAYGWPALVVLVVVALTAATVTLLARAWHWWRDPGHLTGASGAEPGHARHHQPTAATRTVREGDHDERPDSLDRPRAQHS